MIQNVFLIGPGKIGRAFLQRVVEKDLPECKNHINPTNIIGVANSQGFVFCAQGISTKDLKTISHSQEKARDFIAKNGEPYQQFQRLIDVTKKSKLKDIIFVDSTSLTGDMIDFHKAVIRNGFRMVTANKNPLALCSIEDYYLLTQKKGFYEGKTTVMAGNGPWEFIDHKEKISEPISHIWGCVNGTTVFTFNQFNTSDKTFSECFRMAYEAGYTEPNPQDDLNGVDPARKLVILARRSGYLVEYSDVKIEPFLSHALEADPNNFWEELKKEDAAMEKRKKAAQEKNCVLQHVVEMTFSPKESKPHLLVKLKEVETGSPLAHLPGTKNCVLVETPLYSGNNVHEVKSPGAGIMITADSLREGIAEILPEGSIAIHMA